MTLSYNEIKKITFGALRCEETDKGLKFFKCTKKQADAWYALKEVLGERAEKPTGVRIDFHTNSKSLSFVGSGTFEVLINGNYRHRPMLEDGGCVTLDVCDELGETLDDARITIIFHSHSLTFIKSISLDDGSYIKPHEYDTKILFIGDSITQGWDSGYSFLSYAWRVSNFFNADSVIHAVGGGYFHESIFDSIDFDPDTVIIAFGTNDFGFYKTIDELRANTHAFMTKITEEYKGKKIFYISPIWREKREKPMGSFTACRQALIEEASKQGFIHIDGLSLVPPIPEFYADKELHPNALGFGIYAENLIKEMLK